MFVLRKIKDSFTMNINYFNRLNKNIMIFIIYGLLYDTVINLYKPFAVKYLERLGGTNLHITLYNSVPGIVAVVVLLPCVFILSRFKKKKLITGAFIFAARFIILAMAFITVFPPDLQPVLFVALISVLNFPEAVSQSSMQSILGSVFGGKERALALSSRNQFGNFFIMLVTLISGLIISFIPKTDSQRMLCYQIFFVSAFILGLLEVFFFMRLDEKNNPSFESGSKDTPPKLKDIIAIFKDKKFLGFASLSILYYISYHGGWAISSIYTIKSLGANEIWLAIFAVVSGLTSFFSASVWNKFINKKGNDTALVLACLLMGINTFLIALSPNLYMLLFQSAVNGIGVIGLNVTLLNGLLISTPVKNRILYIGAYNTIVNLSLGISPLLIQAVMDRTDVRFSLFFVGFLRILVSSVLFYFLIFKKRDMAQRKV